MFQTEVWVWRGDGVMRVCSFRCLFFFWLDCVRLDVSLSARCSHYGCSDRLLIAAICWVYQDWFSRTVCRIAKTHLVLDKVMQYSKRVFWLGGLVRYCTTRLLFGAKSLQEQLNIFLPPRVSSLTATDDNFFLPPLLSVSIEVPLLLFPHGWGFD